MGQIISISTSAHGVDLVIIRSLAREADVRLIIVEGSSTEVRVPDLVLQFRRNVDDFNKHAMRWTTEDEKRERSEIAGRVKLPRTMPHIWEGPKRIAGMDIRRFQPRQQRI